MEKRVSLDSLLEAELKKLMTAELLTYDGLGEMITACHSKELLSILSSHREETIRQKERLEHAMQKLQYRHEKEKDLLEKGKEVLKGLVSSSSEKEAGKSLKHLLEEGKLYHKKFTDTEYADLALASGGVLVERFEAALYHAAVQLAEGSKHPQIAKLLKDTLKEEENAAELLNDFVKKEMKRVEGQHKHQAFAHA
jgi:ferritin-like metal-binding protein YciE